MRFRNFIHYKFNKNKRLYIILLILVSLLLIFGNSIFVSANTVETENNTKELTNIVNDLVNNIDFSNLEDVIKDIDNINIFNGSIKDKVLNIMNGEYFTNYSSIFTSILSIFFIDIRKILPLLFTILGIGIASNLFNEFKVSNDNVSDIIHFVSFSVVVIILLSVFKNILETTSSTLHNICSQIQIIFPILIAMLTSIGSFSTISIYKPIVAVLSTLVSSVFSKFLYPLFIMLFIFTIIGSLTDTVKLDKLTGFVASSFKWIVGIVFTLFSGFLSLQGITAGKYDSISIKATKFAVRSYIPIIGSYISDGMDFIVLGSVLVKNTIGLVGVIILFITIVSPIITMLVFKLGLQLCSGVLEMTGSVRMSTFINKCSNLIIYPIVLILGVAFMYVITIILIICTANIF